MAITHLGTRSAYSQDLLYFEGGASADVTNVAYLGRRWARSDLTANSKQGRLAPSALGVNLLGNLVIVDTFLFAFSGADVPTQRALVAWETAGLRKLYLNTSGYLEWYDGTNYHQCSSVLSQATAYEIALVRDHTAGSGGVSRELIYVNKAIDLDIALTVPAANRSFRYWGENLGASNPGIYLYFCDFVAYTLGAVTETAYQPAVGFAAARADGSTNTWVKSDAGLAYWEHVDEIPASTVDYLYTNAPSTPKVALEYLSQRATIGPAADDTVLGVVLGWYVRERLNGGTKWAVTAGCRQAANETWGTGISAPGDGVWAATVANYTATRPGGGSWAPADFDDWQLGIEVAAGAEHNTYADWGAGIAFVSYFNAGLALATPTAAEGIARSYGFIF